MKMKHKMTEVKKIRLRPLELLVNWFSLASSPVNLETSSWLSLNALFIFLLPTSSSKKSSPGIEITES
jgi:hypothetical protein